MSRPDDSVVTAIEATDPLVGTVFDKRFRVEERLAAGGFGAIYRARHVKSGHPIALKLLHPTLASDLGVLARFRREGTTLTSLRNPHTITAYEFGQSDKTLFIVMELLHGDSLYERFESDGPMEWRKVARIAVQVCDSLEEAHEQGIVHRDLKPTNIHLEDVDGDPDFVKVLDFGIAKIVAGSGDHDASDITNAGQMIGTLDYMSPEQMVGGQVTGQTDIYTLGIVMYEMIAGTRPFPESQNASAALSSMLKTTPPPLSQRASVPRELEAVVMRCLERDTNKRFKTVGDVRAALLDVLGEVVSQTNTVAVPPLSEEDVDSTTVTPPPDRAADRMADRMIDSLRTSPRQEALSSPAIGARTPKIVKKPSLAGWDDAASDDDAAEGAPTTTRLPDSFEDSTRRAPVLGYADIDEHEEKTRSSNDPFDAPTALAPALPRADAPAAASNVAPPNAAPPSPIPPTPPPVRPLAARNAGPTVPQVVVAPFSSNKPAPAAPPAPPSDAFPPNAYPPSAYPPGAYPPAAYPPGAYPPGAYPSGLAGSPPPVGAFPQLPPTPYPGSSSPSPYGHPAAQPHPAHGMPYMSAPGPLGQPGASHPTMPSPSSGARLPTGYDMSGMAARDAAIRRLVWIAVLVLAAIVGFVLALRH